MADARRSTVFDYSNLLLHPDGTRVHQKSTNSAPRIAKAAVRTFRQNWIARDAGGLSNIRKFRRAKNNTIQQADDEEYISLRTGPESPERDEERRVKRKDDRPAKRRRFLDDLDYLNRERCTPKGLASDTGAESFPYEPSSVRPFFYNICT